VLLPTTLLLVTAERPSITGRTGVIVTVPLAVRKPPRYRLKVRGPVAEVEDGFTMLIVRELLLRE
jgi:hypothetical protein